MNAQEAQTAFAPMPTAWWRSPDLEGIGCITRSSHRCSADWTSSRAAAQPQLCTGVPPRYQIVTELGRGGMGVVYTAKDTKLNRLVALKLLPAEWGDDEIARRRLVCEAQAASATDHPNICTIYDIDSTEAGRLFIVMAHYDGETLQKRLQGKALRTEEVLDISIQITEALEAAHAHGVVHRDIKPGNILICRTGAVKVLDFGLASRLGSASDPNVLDELDIPGSPLGTPNYMAPERILEMPVDPRTDLFSLGVVMYEMATSKKPFAGASITETVTNVLDNDPLPLTSVSPARPLMLERVVNKALAKRPEDRFQSASELRQALYRIAQRRWLPMRARLRRGTAA